MALSSPGIGSNLDVNGIVSQLMSIEQRPLTLLAKKEAAYQSKISAIGSIKGALAAFQTSVANLADPAKFVTTKAVSSDVAVGVTTSGVASAGSYAIEVQRLAQAQKLVAAGQASTTAVIGTGTLSFDVGTISGGTFNAATGQYTGATFTSNGTATKSIVIDSTNNTLSGIKDAINKGAFGVTATIVNDGSATPNRLVLTDTKTGVINSLKIGVTGSAALVSLLANDPAGVQNLAETSTAQNALFKLDGLAISKDSNVVTDAIPNLTLNLAKTNVGTPATITVTKDTSSIQGTVGQFVIAYNQIQQTLTQLSAYNASTKQASVLTGDATVRGIQTALNTVLSAPVTGGSNVYTVLSQVGISVQKDGTLSLDNAKLQAAISANPSQIAGVFAAVGTSTDALVTFNSAGTAVKSGTYALNVTQVATQAAAVGTVAAGLTITAGSNDVLSVVLNGISGSVTLSPGTYATADALAKEVQNKINGFPAFSSAGLSTQVSQAAGVLTIATTSFGSSAKLALSGTALTNLLGTASSSNIGVEVAGTFNGVAGVGFGKTLTGIVGSASDGLSVSIDATVVGPRGSINYSQGYAVQFGKLATSLLDSKGPLAAKIDGLNASLKSIGVDKDRLGVRLAAIEARYRQQFTALDVSIASLNKTSSFLTQQLASLPRPY